MKICFIINPSAGRRNRGLREVVEEFIESNRMEAQIVLTGGPGHATELTRAAVAAGAELVVAVGGDGTINEIARALLYTPVALAIVPCGSGNGLAQHLRIPSRWMKALRLITDRSSWIGTIDSGSADGMPFFNVMGFGLDAEVARAFNASGPRGLPAYARATIAALRRARPEEVRIESPTGAHTMEVLFLSVANSDQFGNNARIAPGAKVDDGLLDLVAVAPCGLVESVAHVARLFTGKFNRGPGVVRQRGGNFVLRRSKSGFIHTDGEVHQAGESIEIEVYPRSLRILLPIEAVTLAAPAPLEGFALHLT